MTTPARRKRHTPTSERKRRRRLRRDPFGRLALAVSDYLKTKGWSVIVVGESRVQQQPLAAAFNYEFVVRFTGGQTKTAEPPEGAMVKAGEIV